MGGVDVSDQRTVAYARLMKGSVWYYKVFFYLIEVCVSNAHILHTKSQNHASLRALQFRKELVSTLVQGKCFRRDTGFVETPVAIPDIRFNRDHFHYLVSNETRLTCKVHIQNVHAGITFGGASKQALAQKRVLFNLTICSKVCIKFTKVEYSLKH